MREEINNPNFKIGQLVLAMDDNSSFKILGCIATARKIEQKWIYTVNWDDNRHGDEPYNEDDIFRFWDLLQQEIDK